MILKTRIREVLDERKMSQKDLAALAGVRESVVSELANNTRTTINRSHFGKIAQALNVHDVSELLYFEIEK